MSKSILVIDTPEDCEDCRLAYTSDYDLCCGYFGRMVRLNDLCPLRPLPEPVKQQKDASPREEALAKGYNLCLQDIGGSGR